jgi:hypothetical protein
MVDLKDKTKNNFFESNFDIAKKSTSHNLLISSICNYLKEKKLLTNEQIKILNQDYMLEETPEYNIEDSLFYKTFNKDNIRILVNGFITETSNTEGKKKYQVVSICEDIRKLDFILAKLYANIQKNKS